MNLSLAGAILAFIILFLIESKRPWRSPERDIPRIRTNLILLILGYLSMATIVPLGFSHIFKVIGPVKGTLFESFESNLHVKVLAGILIFDLKNYVFHRMIHKVRWLWKFHRTHHSDPAVDIFTTQRFHPVELIFGFLPALFPIFVGVPFYSTAIIELIALPWVLFQHSNISVPSYIEKPLSYVFLTPGLHKIHHSSDPADADVNFGVIFSFWDRLFGTLRVKSEPEMNSLTFGARGISDPQETRELIHLLKQPFLPDKDLEELQIVAPFPQPGSQKPSSFEK